ncbi:hypothetical protein V1503_19705 [Bacillus sp. SCS-151]|uniref:hypothetical protein n=1 Tax=Nanhaiella sioensis TaxID=3115293 RepID=UPI00397C7313
MTNAQWDEVGYNLQSSRAFHIDGLLAVIPSDIVIDANTPFSKRVGYYKELLQVMSRRRKYQKVK